MRNVKAKVLICLILAAPMLFVSATVWEGSASFVPGVNFQGETYGIATNSFPRNTVVDVTNLENNRSVRVLVVSTLNNAGLLASLSRDAANAIGMDGNSVRRVRISQPSDSVAFAHIRRGPLPDPAETAEAEAEPVLETDDFEAAEIVDYVPEYDENAEAVAYVPEYDEDAEAVAYVPEYDEDAEIVAYGYANVEDGEFVAEMEPVVTPDSYRYMAIVSEDEGPSVIDTPLGAEGDRAAVVSEPETLEPIAMHEPGIYVPSFIYTLVPTYERLPPPTQELVIAPEYLIPPIEPGQQAPVVPLTEPVPPAPPVIAQPTPPEPEQISVLPADAFIDPIPVAPPADFSPFQAPLVSSLERNMWYVQLGAFAHPHSVEEEITRIGMTYPYPVLIQNIGTDTNPMFRVLLGPLNQGESAAILRRVRSVGNTTAFIRQAN